MWIRWLTALACLLAPTVAHAGKLGSMRSEVRGSSSSESSADDDSSDSDDDGDGGDGSAGASVGAAIAEVIAETNAKQGRPVFASYPYRNGHTGWVHRNGRKPALDAPGKPWSLNVALEGASLGDQVWRASVAAEISWRRLSLRNDTGLYLERPAADASYLGSAAFCVAFLMQPNVVWKLGLGPGYLIDARRVDDPTRLDAAGANLSTTVDVFPVRPVVLSGRADFGNLGAAKTFLVRGTVGFAVRRFEGYGGYEYRGVGNVRFGGPVFGVRLWF